MKIKGMFYSFGLLVLVFGIPFTQSFVITDPGRGDDGELDLTGEDESDPEDINRSIKDISTQQLADDDALMKLIVLDATEDDKSSDDLLKEAESEFLSTVLRLVGEGELYRDARIDAITAALHSAFLSTTGRVDHEYIEQVLKSIREKDEQKRRDRQEHEANILVKGPSVKDSGVRDPVTSRPIENSSSTSTIPPTTDPERSGEGIRLLT